MKNHTEAEKQNIRKTWDWWKERYKVKVNERIDNCPKCGESYDQCSISVGHDPKCKVRICACNMDHGF